YISIWVPVPYQTSYSFPLFLAFTAVENLRCGYFPYLLLPLRHIYILFYFLSKSCPTVIPYFKFLTTGLVFHDHQLSSQGINLF
ncbi:MAG: hypothetical protein ACOC4M_16075, partial [Promethearchaeia archaeon]